MSFFILDMVGCGPHTYGTTTIMSVYEGSIIILGLGLAAEWFNLGFDGADSYKRMSFYFNRDVVGGDLNFKGHFEGNQSNGSGLREPQFEVLRIEIMRTGRTFDCLG